MNQVALGYRIKQCRKMRNLTQEKLAESVNVSPHYIYEIEKGLKTMSLYTLADIVSVLNVPTDYLLFGVYDNSLVSSTKEVPFDRLDKLLQNLSPQERDITADILSDILPHLFGRK